MSQMNISVPPESFSAVFTPETNDTLVYKIEETQQFDSGSVCAWITTKYQGRVNTFFQLPDHFLLVQC